jgi:hypothetical protein
MIILSPSLTGWWETFSIMVPISKGVDCAKDVAPADELEAADRRDWEVSPTAAGDCKTELSTPIAFSWE